MCVVPWGHVVDGERAGSLAERLAAEATRRGVTAEELAVLLPGRQADAFEPAATDSPARTRFRFVGMGDSGTAGGALAVDHDRIRREGYAGRSASEV